MQTHRQTTIEPGTILAPHEIIQEVREFVGALHSIAEDNLDAAGLAASQFATNAFGKVFSEATRSTARSTTIPSTNEYGDQYPILDNAGDPWVVSRTTGDGYLEGSLGITFISTVPIVLRMWVGVMVDGQLVGQSPTLSGQSFEDSLYVGWAVPVGAGVHRIEAVFGYHDAPPIPQVIQWNEGTMIAREVLR
jgi:hypothetical protein